MAHEQSGQCRIRSVQRGESTKHDRGLSEARGVQVDAEKLVDASKTRGVTRHGVVGRCQPVKVLVPRRRAGEKQLDGDSSHADVTESPCKEGSRARRTENEHDEGADKWRAIVTDAIRQPRQHVQDNVLMSRQNVADVRSVEDVF